MPALELFAQLTTARVLAMVEAVAARAALAALLERDVFVRMPAVAPIDRCVRVTVGVAADREAFAVALREVLRGIPRSG